MKKVFSFFLVVCCLCFSGCASVAAALRADGGALAAEIAVSELIYRDDDRCGKAVRVLAASADARKISERGLLTVATLDERVAAFLDGYDISPTSKIIIREALSQTVDEHRKLVGIGKASAEDKITINAFLDRVDAIARDYLGRC